ncbi:MAG TPA: hypothetical protein VK784_10640 [Pseudonocardiaceae bacterium]|nr:hypothetical protein [Pseudonocardiaceae bacterium]
MTSSRMGSYQLRFATPARETLDLLDGSPQYAATLRKVRRALGLLQINPRHPGLHSHQYENFPGAPKAKVWDSYVENRTPGAWRIWWMYGPDEIHDNHTVAVITVLDIGPHP